MVHEYQGNERRCRALEALHQLFVRSVFRPPSMCIVLRSGTRFDWFRDQIVKPWQLLTDFALKNEETS